MEDFFDLLASSNNRFEDQRTHDPKSPVHSSSGPVQIPNRFSTRSSSRFPDTARPSNSDLERLPPNLTASMPDLFSEDEDTEESLEAWQQQLRSAGVTTTPSGYRYAQQLPPSTSRGGPLMEPTCTSEPTRRRGVPLETLSEDKPFSSASASPANYHRASPLATTTYMYGKGNRKTYNGYSGSTSSSTPKSRRGSDISDRSDVSESDLHSTGNESGDDESSLTAQHKLSNGVLPKSDVTSTKSPRRSSERNVHQYSSRSPTHKATSPPARSPSYSSHDDRRREMEEKYPGVVMRRKPGARQSRPSSAYVPSVSNGGQPFAHMFSIGNRSQSMEQMNEESEVQSADILIDAGLGFLRLDSPVVKGVRGASTINRRHSFSRKLLDSIVQEHEM